MMKFTIDVDAVAIIVPYPTGVFYTNQIGGYACHHFKIEGFLVPVKEFFYERADNGDGNVPGNKYWNQFNKQKYFDKRFAPVRGSKHKGHCYKGIDEDDAKYIERAFGVHEGAEVNPEECFLKVDRDKLKDAQEAFIPVTVSLDMETEVAPLKEVKMGAYLTWHNSD